MATMTADANDAGATGTALLTLWKVGRVELQHNLEALASLRRQAEDAKVNSPVVPAQPTIVDAAAGHISSRLHPR
jgi:hypothetical protein